MKVKSVGITDVGRERTNNEDSLLIDDTMGLYIVADGMGGHENGEMASRQAIRAVYSFLQDRKMASRRHQLNTDVLVEHLAEAVQEAAATVHRLSHGERGMGTTLTALWLAQGKGIMAHIGDSRLYGQRDEAINQISKDHTFVALAVERGQCTPEEAEKHPMSNVLMRCLGREPKVEVDTLVLDVEEKDTFLLCSDGLTSYLHQDELENMLISPDIEAIGKRLINIANGRGGHDNITVVLVHVEDLGDGEAQASPQNMRIPTLVNFERKPTR